MIFRAFRKPPGSEPSGGVTARVVVGLGRWEIGLEVHPQPGWLIGLSKFEFRALLRSILRGTDRVALHLIWWTVVIGRSR